MNGKWKSRLLPSSLEFEVAKELVQRGFAVRSDFTYGRADTAVLKDFSVDLRANLYTRPLSTKRPPCSFDLLVECKQRLRKQWLFYPDPNRLDFMPYVAEFGETVRGVDEFSKWFVRNDDFAAVAGLPIAYKAVEIDSDDGSVYDSEFRHGIFQLQFAIPRLLTENIMASAASEFEDGAPFFIAAMLVTNAELIVAHKNLTARTIERAQTPQNLGRVVPYVLFYSDIGSG